jgi:peptide chain release factor
MEEKVIQITSGRGPLECCRVVAKVLELMLKQAKKLDLKVEVLSRTPADLKGTLQSAVLMIKGKQLAVFVNEWQGTVQWIAQSPYRKFHKRKNWFVGVEVFDLEKEHVWDASKVRFETLRSSGPGGQNVNKVETAVRGVHIPSGLQVLAMDTNSQLQNKKLCIQRLEQKVRELYSSQLSVLQKSQWDEHNCLERGNPVKVIQERLE